AVREESPSNLATLCYKAVEKLVQGAESGCPTEKEKQIVLNCARMLSRILPYIFEDQDWRGFFWMKMKAPVRWQSLSYWLWLTCSSVQTSLFRATRKEDLTRLKTCGHWTVVNISGRLEWVSLSPPHSTTSMISTGERE
uniref:Uncharacterized protein n=1 Tax=Sinocyclocheilus grahami TaxID=75366 RepID=A0A672NS12_SINGR